MINFFFIFFLGFLVRLTAFSTLCTFLLCYFEFIYTLYTVLLSFYCIFFIFQDFCLYSVLASFLTSTLCVRIFYTIFLFIAFLLYFLILAIFSFIFPFFFFGIFIYFYFYAFWLCFCLFSATLHFLQINHTYASTIAVGNNTLNIIIIRIRRGRRHR